MGKKKLDGYLIEKKIRDKGEARIEGVYEGIRINGKMLFIKTKELAEIIAGISDKDTTKVERIPEENVYTIEKNGVIL